MGGKVEGIYIYVRERDRQTDRDRDRGRQTDRDRDTERGISSTWSNFIHVPSIGTSKRAHQNSWSYSVNVLFLVLSGPDRQP